MARVTRQGLAGVRLGRRFGVALFVSALLVAPAHAASVTHTVDVRPTTFRGNPVSGEKPVLHASVALPRGQVRADDDLGIFWTSGGERCPARVFVAAAAAPKAVKWPGGRLHAGRGSVLLRTATGDRRVAATTLVGRNRRDLLAGVAMVQVRLPPDLIPGYARRTVYVIAGAIWPPGNCSNAPERRAARIARAAIRRAEITVPATYTPPPPANPPKPLDLAATPGVLMRGIEASPNAGDRAVPGGQSGIDVAAAGDVNGDGLADALISSPLAGRGRSGIVTVVFGRRGAGALDLGRIGAAGFQIRGPVRDTYALAAAGIGDLDGDGLGDLVVGAPTAAKGGGAAYVIRGEASNATVDLAKPGNRLLFKIAGGRPCRRFPFPGELGGDNIGGDVAGPGDVNGDGLPDVAVLAHGNCIEGARSGVYVVFGARDGRTVDLRHLRGRGITVPADHDAELANAQIAPAGDVNGDGFADLAIGRGEAGPGVPLAEVVLGGPGGRTIRQSALTFVVRGSTCEAGRAASAAGDVNGDGVGDLLVGGGPSSCREDGSGRAYVVFGSRSPGAVDVDRLAEGGIAIIGPAGSNMTGAAAGIGDVNGDGLADVAVADEDATVFGRRYAGEVFLVPGRREPGTVELQYAGATVLAWGGSQADSRLGVALDGVGDFDGDGRPDLLAGAPFARSEAGAAYLLPMP